MTPDQFVDQLFMNTGVTPSVTDRQAAINEFATASNTADAAARARALRRIAENSTLAQQEFNRSFVLMQYFGYLRHNPNDATDMNFVGYNFWLNKLNEFNVNFVAAEMVTAFISSGEYRQRFSQNAVVPLVGRIVEITSVSSRSRARFLFTPICQIGDDGGSRSPSSA